jgi:NADH dehydrogenase [ubiquinone] 1 alpha subcomplex assembly factor 7
MSPLEEIIRAEIRASGPISMARYMELCLAHPEHGYYMTHDPFGAAGDFTTAPEISQMFGELIGLWLADLWMRFGKPDPFVLLECGPGRGVLMDDLMRATKNVPGFHAAAKLHLMEISPVLKEIQKQKLGIYDPVWIDDLSQVSSTSPVFFVANEFLDALPIHQVFLRNGTLWEKAVGLDRNGAFCEVEISASEQTAASVYPQVWNDNGTGVAEISPIINQFLKKLCILLQKQTGIGLFVDYGYLRSTCGDTLQALKGHTSVPIFETPGLCDLTAHVDFENIERIAGAEGIHVYGPATQGAFLQDLGIGHRAARLLASANPAQKEDIERAVHRLIHPSLMGDLFKVLALCHSGADEIVPAGFA